MTKEQYKNLLISRILEEKKELQKMMKDYEKMGEPVKDIMNNQYGYVAGLEHALRLLGE